jgi:hypothetical protein
MKVDHQGLRQRHGWVQVLRRGLKRFCRDLVADFREGIGRHIFRVLRASLVFYMAGCTIWGSWRIANYFHHLPKTVDMGQVRLPAGVMFDTSAKKMNLYERAVK